MTHNPGSLAYSRILTTDGHAFDIPKLLPDDSMCPEAPTEIAEIVQNVHKWNNPKMAYLASADQWLGFDAFFRKNHLMQCDVFYCVIGGLGGLNLLMRLNPLKKIFFYDANPYASLILDLQLQLIRRCTSVNEYISLIYQRPFDASKYDFSNQEEFLRLPVEQAYEKTLAGFLSPRAYETYRYFYLPYILRMPLHTGPTNLCTHLLPFFESAKLTDPLVSGLSSQGVNVNTFYVGKGWLSNDETFQTVRSHLLNTEIEVLIGDIAKVRPQGLFSGLYMTNIYSTRPGCDGYKRFINLFRWAIGYDDYTDWEVQYFSQGPKEEMVECDKRIGAGNGDPHATCCQAIDGLLDLNKNKFLEVIQPHPTEGMNYGFRFYKGQKRISVADYLKTDASGEEIIVLHILLGAGVPQELWREVCRKAVREANRCVMIFEHRKECSDWPQWDVHTDNILPHKKLDQFVYSLDYRWFKYGIANTKGSTDDIRNIMYFLKKDGQNDIYQPQLKADYTQGTAGFVSPKRDVPVALVVYNRPKHTLEVLKALRQHDIKKIYIFADALKIPEHEQGVRQVRQLIRSIDWTTPEIIERTENIGLAKSIIGAADYVFERHDRMILFEDDCVPQQYFFDFVCTCLEKYKDNPQIFGVTGYSGLIPEQLLHKYPYDLYFSPRICSWGWATWKRAWRHFGRDLKQLVETANENRIDISQGGEDIPLLVEHYLKGRLKDVWTLNWELSVNINNGYYVFPTRSHIKNIGMDGTGVHCTTASNYEIRCAEEKPGRYPPQAIVDNNIVEAMKKPYRSDTELVRKAIAFIGTVRRPEPSVATQNRTLKVAEDYVNSGITVDTHSSFGRHIKELFARITPQKIIETGTYLGTGTTTIIANALKDLGIKDAVFYTIEVNPKYYSKATQYFRENNIKVYALNGLSIPRAMIPGIDEIVRRTITDIEFDGIFVDHREQNRAQFYYRETDFPNVPDNLLYKCLKNLDFKPDFVLLDSAGHLGNIEFDYLIENLKGKCYIALDDIYHIKHHRDFLKMQSDKRFEIISHNDEKFGYCIAGFEPNPVSKKSAKGPSNTAETVPACKENVSDSGKRVLTGIGAAEFGEFLKSKVGAAENHIDVVNILERLTPDQYLPEDILRFKRTAGKNANEWSPVSLLNAIGKQFRIENYLEIGVRRGRSLSQILAHNPDANIYAFDLWVSNYADAENPGPEFVQSEMEKVGYKKRINFYSGDSAELLPKFFQNPTTPKYFDVIFVDGDHSYEGALKDLHNVVGHLKPGGILIFDDVNHPLHKYLAKAWDIIKAENPCLAYYETDYGNGLRIAFNKQTRCSDVTHGLNAPNCDDLALTGTDQTKKTKTSPHTKQNHRILIVRPDAIGDFVLFAGTLKYYRRLFDNTEIHLLVKKHVAELAKNCPDVDCLIEFEAKMLEEDESYSNRLFSHLKEQKYDIAIYPVYSRSPQGDLLTLESGASQTIAFDGNCSNIAEPVKKQNDVKYTRLVPTSKEWSLEIKRSEEMVCALGIGPDEPVTPKVWLTDEDNRAARQLLSQMKIEDSIIFCPFAQHAIRHWPVDNWAQLLTRYNQFPVLICGSADNHQEAEQIIKLSGHTRAFNLCGKTNLRQLAALLKNSKLCVGVESAAGHIAAVVGCPHVILIGGGHFGRFMPYSPLTTLVYAQMECYRCNWDCKFEKSRCITQISVETVDKAIQQTLKRTGESLTAPLLIEENSQAILDTCTTPQQSSIGYQSRKDAIVIATSIAPKEIDKQVKAINSWHTLGFKVISVNNPDEIKILRQHFPLVNFIEAKRNAKALLGKPYIYIDDILEQLNAAGCQICGIVNSDIYIAANEDTVSFIRKEAENSFVYGSRVEVDSLAQLNGQLYDRGFDFFFFDKSLIPLFPKSDFCIGATWWDYWLPLVSILSGRRTKMFVTPFAAHVRHRYKWDEKQWHLFAGKIYDYIAEKVREKSEPGPLTGSLDLAARMISAHTYFIIKRKEKVRNKDEYRQVLCQSCGKAILEFLKIASQPVGKAGGKTENDVNAEIYEGRDNTLDISFDNYHKAVELNRQGESLIKRGDTEKALSVFEQAIRIVPNLAAAYNNIGALLSKNNPTAALKHFMKALKADAAYIPAVNNTAELLLHSGKTETARNFILGSAQLCSNFGMPSKTIEIYKAYLQECPSDAVISGELKKLESVKPPEYDGVPLVFVNWGNGRHLKYSLAQALLFNRKSKIYLIGDQTNNKYDFVEHYDCTQFSSDAQQFAPLYKHLSPNPPDFELRCFLRWFIIRDFLKSMNLTRCVALDSDVMAYACLSDHWHRFSKFGMTVSGGVSPHCNFISDVELLSEFCDFLIQSYSDPASLKKMEDFYEPWRGTKQHGISDMAFFEKFRKKHPDRIGEITNIFYGTKFDPNMNMDEKMFEMENGLKKIYWFANSPQGKIKATGDLVAFETLHFQGPAKEAIPNHFMGELVLSPQGRWNVRMDGDVPYVAQMDKKPAIDYILKPSVPGREEPKYLITAIVSTYNDENFIRGCLEDLENQTIADKIEIIVVDSASQQDEESIVLEFQKRYNNIVYIRTRKREGLYSSWNRAINSAHGQFLTSANTDDRHRRDTFEIMSNELLAATDIALVYGDQIVTDTPNPTFENHHAIKTAQQPEFSRERLLFGCCVGSQPMWRKSLHDEFGGFDETLTCAADWDFWLKASSKYRFKHIPQILGLYYENQEGIEHGNKIHSLYERYLVGKRYGNPYISIIEPFTTADNPLISVWMAAYNAQDYIAESIETVLIQNYRNFELLIVDDGSTDRTSDIVHSFKDEHIKYFLKEHGGLASARNVQLQKSNGSFIVILDSDDIMSLDFLTRHLIEFQQHPEADMVYCDDLLIDENKKPIRVINRPEYQDGSMLISDLFRCGFPVVPFRTCIRKSVFDKIGPYDEQLLVAEDYDMLRRFVRQGFKIHHLPEALYLRRVNTKSHSRNFDAARAKSQLEAVRRFTETFTPEQLFPDMRWNEMPASQKLVLAKCKAACVYMGIGEQYLKTNISDYASAGFELGCAELDQCCRLEPTNQQIITLREQCRSIRDKRLATSSTVYQKV